MGQEINKYICRKMSERYDKMNKTNKNIRKKKKEKE